MYVCIYVYIYIHIYVYIYIYVYTYARMIDPNGAKDAQAGLPPLDLLQPPLRRGARRAMLLFVEPVFITTNLCPAEYADIV